MPQYAVGAESAMSASVVAVTCPVAASKHTLRTFMEKGERVDRACLGSLESGECCTVDAFAEEYE